MMAAVGHSYYRPPIRPRRRRLNARTIARLLGIVIAEAVRQLLA